MKEYIAELIHGKRYQDLLWDEQLEVNKIAEEMKGY